MTDIVERLRGLDRDAYDWFAVVDKAAAEIERLREHVDALRLVATAHEPELERLRAALRGLLDEVMCFVVDPPSAALNHAIEEAGRALEPKP